MSFITTLDTWITVFMYKIYNLRCHLDMNNKQELPKYQQFQWGRNLECEVVGMFLRSWVYILPPLLPLASDTSKSRL